MASLESDLGIVRNVLGKLFFHDLIGLLRIESRAESHGASDCSHWSQDITCGHNFWKTFSTCDCKIGSPSIIKIHFCDVILIHVFDTFMHLILVVKFISELCSNIFCFLLFEFWDLYLKFIANSSSFRIIESVQKKSGNSEGFRDDASSFSTVLSDFSSFDFAVNDANASERGSQPELVVVKSA